MTLPSCNIKAVTSLCKPRLSPGSGLCVHQHSGWAETKPKRETQGPPPCGVHIKSFLISSVPLSWMHARGQHVWGRTKSWWTLAAHHSSQERRTDPGAFTGLSPSHQAAASECERSHNPQSPPEPIAPSFPSSNSPLSIFFFGKEREFAIVEIFFMSCVSSSSPSEVHRLLFCYISLTFSAPGPLMTAWVRTWQERQISG